ncbi:hypothetical protein CLAVI_000965 [Candidatus Clavichlamydia salmonicola]|uniref:hypothetical protein n=1 Tax=Candidatus Clavichlamydia salmonicola TaxID=469812 RepID=UPI001890F2FE|nr:hypothetical protein [Candidatus Clavichlamydia salmonicola]MBF5051324.1 hypothetical protein [Candidatus Clavichlamydia salmonicola]
MPYFTLSYPQTFEASTPNSFIVQELQESLSLEKIQTLTLLVEEIFKKHLPCTAVPSSFLLNPLSHSNSLNIVTDVLVPLTTLLNEVEITLKNQTYISALNCAINSCLLKSNALEFVHPLPLITTVKSPFLEENLTNFEEISSGAKKRSGSPLQDMTCTKKQCTNVSKKDEDLFLDIETLLCDYQAPNLHIDPQDFCFDPPGPSILPTFECPIIEIMAERKRFIISHTKTHDLLGALQHLYQGAQYVLEEKIYLTSGQESSPLSTIHAYHNTLSALLFLLSNQYFLFNQIPNEMERFLLKEEFTLMIQDISLSLKSEGFTEQTINQLQKTALQDSSLEEAANIAPSPQSIYSIESSNNKKSIPSISLNDHTIFLTAYTLNTAAFYIDVHTGKKFPSCNPILAKINQYLENASFYTCLKPIKEFPLQSSDKKTDVLQALYIIVNNNYHSYKKLVKIKPHNEQALKLTLDKINAAFCEKMGLEVNPNEHSSLLLNLFSKTTDSNASAKTYTFIHYHLRLKLKQKEHLLIIEFNHYSTLSKMDLLKNQLKYMHKIFKAIKSLLKLDVVTIRANQILGIEDQKAVPITSLIPQLHLLMKYNKQAFQAHQQNLENVSSRYSSTLNLLNQMLERLKKATSNDSDISDSEPIESTNPLCQINPKPHISEQAISFSSVFFSIVRHGSYYYLSYMHKHILSLIDLKYATSKSLLAISQDYLKLLDTPLSNIIYFEDPTQSKTPTKIQDNAHLVTILYKGFSENFFYYKENHHKLLSGNKKSIVLKSLELALNTIKEKASSRGVLLPMIVNATTLKKFAAHLVANPETKKNKLSQKLKKIDFQPSKETINYITPIFCIKNSIAFNSKNSDIPVITYYLTYQLRINSISASHNYTNPRNTLTSNLKIIKHLCLAQKNATEKIKYTPPFSPHSTLVSKKEALKIIYAGLNDNLNFLCKYYPTLMQKTLLYQVKEDTLEAIALVKQDLKDDLPPLKTSILKQILLRGISNQKNCYPSLKDISENEQYESNSD